jgi:glycosyltransferase involved in cell wall biosynthesis
MTILVFHGYLLGGTGSNVYNAELAPALVGAGHDVALLSQDREPERLPWVDAAGDWDGGVLAVRALRDEVRCTAYRPDIGGLLPVYVADRYEGVEAKTFLECTDEEVEGYVERNVAAVREVAERARPDLALANHLVMGPAILARALGPLGIPYAVKVHGSALEYVVKRDPIRFLPYAREGLAGARAVLVGSRHTAESLWAAMEDPDLPAKTRLGPPGVDVHTFAPREPEEAAEGVRGLAKRLRPEVAAGGSAGGGSAGGGSAEAPPASAFDRDLSAIADALDRVDPSAGPLVAYVGKLIVSKGVDLLAAAWPLVLQRVPDATLVVVGFGGWRDAFERLLAALGDGDLDAVRALAEEGRGAEGGPAEPLRHLLAFLDDLPPGYLDAARSLPGRVIVVGRLEHAELVDLLPACAAQVVPSTFPEAFGMVAAEAAACGALPVSAAHSGLAEVTEHLAAAVPPPARPWLSFRVGPNAVPELADRVVAWLEADPALRAETREALVRVARERFSWEGVARGVVAAAEGRLDDLDSVSATPVGPVG